MQCVLVMLYAFLITVSLRLPAAPSIEDSLRFGRRTGTPAACPHGSGTMEVVDEMQVTQTYDPIFSAPIQDAETQITTITRRPPVPIELIERHA